MDIFNSIKQVYIPNPVIHIKNNLIHNYKKINYINNRSSCLFFGIYNESDLTIFKNHIGLRVIIWGHLDIRYRDNTTRKIFNYLQNIENIQHLSISENMCEILNAFDIENELINIENLNLNKNIFKPVSIKGNCIYISNGTSNRLEFYNSSIYNKIIKILPNFTYIYSNELKVELDKIPQIYSKCFIGLRLTDSTDHSSSTVNEFECMNIPIIHNSSKYGLKWNDLDDIIGYIYRYNPNKSIEIYNVFTIPQLYVSKTINYLKNDIKNIYGKTDYTDVDKPCLFVGVYTKLDLDTILNHNGKKIVIWVEYTLNYKDRNIKRRIEELKKQNITHLSINEKVKNKLNIINIINHQTTFDLINKQLYKPITRYGKYIFIYNGFKSGKIENQDIYNTLTKYLKNFNFIYSNEQNYEDIINIYKKCFMCICLIDVFGIEYISTELRLMNIPLICNTTTYGLKWKDLDDVYKYIDKYNHNKNISVYNFYNTKQLYVSKHLNHFKGRFMNLYNKIEYSNNNISCIFFGIYDMNDFQVIQKHNGYKIIIWGGSDFNSTATYSNIIDNLQNIKNIIHISISDDLQNRLNKKQIKNTRIEFSLVDKNIFKPFNHTGDCIYIYNGFNTSREHIYGDNIYKEVIQKLPNHSFIFSNNIKMPHEKMPNIYRKCFIGLRLTKNDGNANTVEEFKCMNIPIIHNQSEYGLKWKNVDDIVSYINKYSPYFRNHISDEIDMFNLYHLDNKLISKIKNNIDIFSNYLKNYKNILFMCGDFPGYGGAASNCSQLANYYKQLGYNVFSIYYIFDINKKQLYKEDIFMEDYCILQNIDKISITLKNINFNPDIVILKSFIDKINIRNFFDIPIIYLIGGIYSNSLDNYYYNTPTKYINKQVLFQIENSDKVFCNSSHTRDILKTHYNIDTYLFYSSFIPYYNKEIYNDEYFDNRQYEYGLIVSNFDRKIKNIGHSIQYLKNKKNVILIGKNSYKYKDFGFTCVDLVDSHKIEEFYRKIKYIRQDSFYESCSNVKIEALYNGCIISNEIQDRIIEFKINYSNLSFKYKLNKGNFYLLSSNLIFNDKLNFKYYKYNYELRLINNNSTRDLFITIKVDDNVSMTLKDILYKCKFMGEDNHIAYSIYNFKENEIINLYYLYGQCNIDYNYIGLSPFYNSYINGINNNINRTYNRYMMLFCYSYYLGEKNKHINDLYKILNKNIYHTKKCLIISKLLQSYGGVQKVTSQLIEFLDYNYNIHLICNKMSRNIDFNFFEDYCISSISNNLLIKETIKQNIIDLINNNKYDYIINNKHHEYFDIIHKINTKTDVFIHNSKDVLNDIIIDKQKYINKVFVVSNFHRNLLYFNGLNKKCCIYKNYVFNEYNNIITNVNKQNRFQYNICYIGRIDRDKNIQLLLDVFQENSSLDYITLYIIGSGKYVLNKKEKSNIIFTGKLSFQEIIEYLDKCDYVVSASLLEGKPYSIIESMSVGVPCIHSNINSINELVIENYTGYLFKLKNYDQIKYNFNFNLDVVNNINETNMENLKKTIQNAYNIKHSKWLELSKNCIHSSKNFHKNNCKQSNILNLSNIVSNNIVSNTIMNKYKIFVNFKPDDTKAYGGGNISVYYIVRNLLNVYNDFEIIYEFEKKIDIYLIIDVLKGGEHKKYGIEEIVNHKVKYNNNSKIIIRINDCDITRKVSRNNSRESKILQFHTYIDYFIYNSYFIKNYYLKNINDIRFKRKQNCVIYNGVDLNMFKNNEKIVTNKYKIVTHHWSSNINKGYEIYHKLWKYTRKNNKYEFIFIGKHVPTMFKEVPIIGPFVKEEISNELNKCHIYITASKYDSCPNHVLEGISCGLPILYQNVEGGARELCQLSQYKIGEMFNNYDDLLIKMDKIVNNYSFYRDNIQKSISLYDINICVNKYNNIFYDNIMEFKHDITLMNQNNIITIHNTFDYNYIRDITNGQVIKLIKGKNVFLLSSVYNKLKLKHNVEYTIDLFKEHKNKCNNDKFNVLLCSDSNYFVGLFAVLNSLYENVNFLENLHFNFIIDYYSSKYFVNMLETFEKKNNIILSKTIIYIDIHTLDSEILSSKCFNGGGHLLNIGNISRLLIGEFFNYKKLIYLDSDSIVQYDIFNKLQYFHFTKFSIYAGKADKYNRNKAKQIVIKNGSIIECNYNWKDIIGYNIDAEECCYMGAPFIADCSKWNNVYKKCIEILSIHNNDENGVFKLFTMSLQNIIFYNDIGNLNNILNLQQDLGSTRKKWSEADLIDMDILDWSGMYKPWYKNGLYKKMWQHYDILNLKVDYDYNIISKKDKIEKGLVINNVLKNKEQNTTIQPILTNINKNNRKFISASTLLKPNKKIDKKNNNIQQIIQKQRIRINKDYLNINDISYEKFKLYLEKMSVKNDNSKYNILYVCDIEYLYKKMSRVRFWPIEIIGNREDVDLQLIGPGFNNYNMELSLQENILNMGINFSLIIWYKPLDKKYNFNKNIKLPFKTCLRYNEMWDIDWTREEIDESNTDIIICHHYNDYLKYNKLYRETNRQFYYIPHQASPTIFKNLNTDKDIDILIAGVTKEKHYPLKHKLLNIINKHKDNTLSKYNIHHHLHPGYNKLDNFTNINQIEYNKLINRSKICVACTSKHKYRLGKYVEIPMGASVILGDIPFEDVDSFKQFVIEINIEDSEEDVINKVVYYLENQDKLNICREKGLEWSKQFTTKKYVDTLMSIIQYNNNNEKIFIISDEIKDDHEEFKNEKWICDTLKQEFIDSFPNNTTTNAKDADIIWYLAPWNSRYIPSNLNMKSWVQILENKKVVMTQHHIDPLKVNKGILEKQFEFMKKYTNRYHSICNITTSYMKNHFNIDKIYTKKLWINSDIFYEIKDKKSIRNKYNFSENSYLIGSFQKDTEGLTDKPKLSKGPDIFINIIGDMYKTNSNIEVILTGLRRTYIINRLEELGIKYHYFNMISLEKINELYNCLDLYVVSSRYEGGPRSIFEAGLTNTPIISTKVGIAPEVLDINSIYDYNEWESYKNAKPNTSFLYNNVHKLSTKEYKLDFFNNLFTIN